ncbi:CPBP family intramembrane glutamic endopeptidase [Halostella litorea]|uniref:CPBP family intramembrane glutamic endopeptidase n=1 Tax=Halostella litorea TaxID=2528831 RepID=UPI0010927776|nr:CPBP family intramembrane glutamic endopeptidase [Halostella litorea]
MNDTAVAGEYAGAGDRSLAPDAGAFLAAVALLAAVLLLSDGVLDDVTVAVGGVVVAGVAAAAFFARRRDVLSSRTAAPAAAAGSLAAAAVGGYALAVGGSGEPIAFGLTPLAVGGIGTLVGGLGGVLAAVADWRAIPDARLASMTRSTAVSTGLGLFGYLMLNVGALVVALLLLLTVWPEITPVREQFVSAGGLLIGTAVTAYVFVNTTGATTDFFDVRVPSLRDVGWAVAGVFIIFGGLIAVTVAYQALGVPSSSHSTVEQAAGGNPEILLVLIPITLLVIGPCEELIFRNIVQKSLYDAFTRPVAVVVASVVFALVHIPAYGGGAFGATVGSLATLFTLSIVLGAVYARTDNILVPAFVHGVLNAVQFASLYVELTGGVPALV